MKAFIPGYEEEAVRGPIWGGKQSYQTKMKQIKG
jgi:hypothetical protein